MISADIAEMLAEVGLSLKLRSNDVGRPSLGQKVEQEFLRDSDWVSTDLDLVGFLEVLEIDGKREKFVHRSFANISMHCGFPQWTCGKLRGSEGLDVELFGSLKGTQPENAMLSPCGFLPFENVAKKCSTKTAAFGPKNLPQNGPFPTPENRSRGFLRAKRSQEVSKSPPVGFCLRTEKFPHFLLEKITAMGDSGLRTLHVFWDLPSLVFEDMLFGLWLRLLGESCCGSVFGVQETCSMYQQSFQRHVFLRPKKY